MNYLLTKITSIYWKVLKFDTTINEWILSKYSELQLSYWVPILLKTILFLVIWIFNIISVPKSCKKSAQNRILWHDSLPCHKNNRVWTNLKQYAGCWYKLEVNLHKFYIFPLSHVNWAKSTQYLILTQLTTYI